ncbi:hypothetical protein PILCRDRAFT_826121 [Piloderma croceum F 1598]|uniref:Uncharacterized protein n=1 Tax=Piloderma croceum (strain F 1598) TaxID=765440 RepID=A0A0C3EW38_PILCF|nr:hypothetical protein PILCRDRAFT_826121 [Piloderma croceum F 1598]
MADKILGTWDELVCLLMEVALSPPLVYPVAMANIPGERFTDNYLDSCRLALAIFAGR